MLRRSAGARAVPPSMALVSVLALTACSSQGPPVAWTFRFASDALLTRAAVVRTEIRRGGCDGPAVYSTDVVHGAVPTMAPPTLDPGPYGIAGRAYDGACVAFAAGCRPVTLPVADNASTDVVLDMITDTPLCPLDQCVRASCAGRDGLTTPCDTWDTINVEPQCSGCGVTFPGFDLLPTVQAGNAYVERDFGGPSGWTGTLYAHQLVRRDPDVTYDYPIALLQVDDTSNNELFEVFATAGGPGGVPIFGLYSPAGALLDTEIYQTSMAHVPADRYAAVDVELVPNTQIRMDADGSVVIVDLSGFTGTTAPARYLRAGITKQSPDAPPDAALKRMFERESGVSQDGPVMCDPRRDASM